VRPGALMQNLHSCRTCRQRSRARRQNPWRQSRVRSSTAGRDDRDAPGCTGSWTASHGALQAAMLLEQAAQDIRSPCLPLEHRPQLITGVRARSQSDMAGRSLDASRAEDTPRVAVIKSRRHVDDRGQQRRIRPHVSEAGSRVRNRAAERRTATKPFGLEPWFVRPRHDRC
jgi:hypothetical protein